MCKLCEKKPVYEFTNQRKLCAKCFVRWFQKKVLYTIRKFGMIQQGDIISYVSGIGFKDVVLEDVLKMFAKKARVELKKIAAYSQMNKKLINEKIAISDTLDNISSEIVEQILNGDVRKLKMKPVEGKIIKPLFLFLDKEVLLYAKLRKLQYKNIKDEKNEISGFINDLEKKHPEIKNAIVKGWLKINN